MPALVILAPARPRLSVRGSAAAASAAASELDFVFGASSGRAAPPALPRGDSTVVVLADADVAWHRTTLPRAPASRLRAALGGVLEDALLDDDAALHLALAPKSVPGQPAWVAVVDKGWLASLLAAIEAGGVAIDRVVPSSQPGATSGHFTSDADEPDAAPTLALAHDDGVSVLRAAGTLARSLLPADLSGIRWTASPQAAAAAERWLGAPVAVLTDGERALAAAESSPAAWDLRQFDLAPRHRGTRAARDAWRRFLSPDWRPVRWGIAALVVVQLLGLNLLAWRQQRAIDGRRAEMTALLQSAHPGVRAVIDAPLQMQRETELLRTVSGRAGDADLDVLLGAAAAAWPDGQGPAQGLRYDGGRLTLPAPGWGEPQLTQFRDRLKAGGYAVELADGSVSISRAAGRAG